VTDNRYDAIIAGRAPQPRNNRARQLEDKYSAIITRDTSNAAQVNALDANDPDTAARANRYERQLGVPARIAQDDIGTYDTMARQRQVAAAAAAHPNVGRFLANPRNAAVGSDDTPSLADISKSFQSYWSRPKPKQSWLQWAKDLPSNIAGSIGAGIYGAAEGATQALRAAGELRDKLDPVGNLLDYATGTSARLDAAKAQYKRRTGRAAPDLLPDLIAGQRANAARLRPKPQGFVADALYSGIESVPSSVVALGAGLLGAPAVGLGTLGLTTGGTAYGQARDEQYDPIASLNYAVAQGGVEVLTERIPVMKFLEDTKVGTPFFKRLVKNFAAEQVGEQTATAAQDFTQWATIDSNHGKTFGDYLRERPAAAAQTALAVAATVGSTNVAIAAGEKAVSTAARIQAARRDGETLAGIVAGAAKSKLKARDPEAFRQFVAQTAEGTDAEHVYIPASAIDTFMQSEGFEDADGFFEELRPQLDEARATGGDVVVPVADVAARLAGTPAWEALKEDARLDAGGMSLRDTVDEGKRIADQIDSRGAEILQQAQDQAAADAPTQAVYDDVKNKLLAIGQPTRVAEHNAAVFAANREAWGARLGMTAEQYHATNPVDFTRASFDTSGAAAVMDQDAVFDFTTETGGAGRDVKIGDTRITYGVGSDGAVELISLRTPAAKRGKGSARAALRALTQQADAAGVHVTLGASPLDRRTRLGSLVDFYRSEGFEPTGRKINAAGEPEMRREPAQTLNQGPRGQIALYGDRAVITLFERSDLSTLIHETGHLFLDELQKNAEAENAPADVVADWQTVKQWFEANNAPLTDGVVPREAHELWARGFERYAMEGKAPSSALQRAFAAFRSWLLRIYAVVDNLRAPITPEVREVFDRLLATQDAIDSYRAQQNIRSAWTDADQAGMTAAEWAAYQASLVKAQDDAYDALLFKTMHRIRVRRTQEYRDAYKRYREDATAEIDAQPRFRLLRLLRTGKLDDREIAARVDREWLHDRYGEDAERRLPTNVRVAQEGMDGDDLAQLTGFASGDEAIKALFDIADNTAVMRDMGDKRQFRERLIDDMAKAAATDAGIADPLTDGTIEEEAIAAISNDTQGDVLATELRHLARRTAAAPTPYRLARDWARRKIESGTVNDVASKSAQQRYARAAAKAGREFEAAIIAGDADAAFRHKQAQMLNHALFVESKNAGDEVEVIVRRMGRLANRAAMKSVDQDYFDRVHEMLEKFDFRPKSQRFLDEKEGFNDWAAKRIAEGFEVAIPPRLAESGDHYSRIQLLELYALRDTVDSLVALGRHKQKLLDGQREREFAEVKNDIIENLRQLPDRYLPKKTFNEDTKRRSLRDVVAGGLKISTLALDMDVQNQNGPMMNLLVHRATDAENKRAQLRDLVMEPLAKLYSNMPAKQWRRLNELVTIPELTLRVGLGSDDPRLGQPITVSRKELLAVALNTGNASNFDKMTQGERWNPQTLRDVLNRELTREDWQLVQAMWDNVNKLWPHIVATERALSGVVPEKVENTPVETPHGIFAGGYWPVVYDSERSGTAEKNSDQAADDMFGRRSGLATPKGHTITRTEATGPMVYSVEQILMNHVEKVITRLAYAEYARDVMRVVGDDAIKGMIDLKQGREYRRQIAPWLQRQITSYVNIDGAKFMEKVLRYTRQGITVVGMGLRWSTGVAQISGLGSSLGRLGAKETPRLVNNMRRTIMALPAMAAGRSSEVHDFVFSRSEQMQRRLRESSVEVSTAFRKLSGKHSYVDNVMAWSMWHIGMVDLHVVSIPTWLTGYQSAIDQGMTDAQASGYADQMVVTSQGGGRAKDLSAWQAPSSEASKLFVMFYTPFNVIFNAQWEAARGVKRGDYTRAANLTFFFLVAQTLADALLSGDWPDDDKEWPEATIEWLARNVGFGLFSGIPFARDAATYGERKLSGQYASFGGTPIQRIFEDMGKSAANLYKVQQGEKEFEPDAVPGIANTAGTLFHLPLGQPGSTAKFLWQYERGEVEPQTLGDWYTGLSKGKMASEEKKK